MPHAVPAPLPRPPPRPASQTHVQAGVVGEQPVVAECHVLLLPLLVQGLATPLEQDALRTETSSETGASPRGPLLQEGVSLPGLWSCVSDRRQGADGSSGH